MTIDKAIECERNHKLYPEYHEQLAEWLEELKVYQQHEIICNKGYNAGYNKAIDDFVNACKEDILCQSFGLHANGIERIAEQLKAGGNNGTDNQ